jgi:hypothetical protein
VAKQGTSEPEARVQAVLAHRLCVDCFHQSSAHTHSHSPVHVPSSSSSFSWAPPRHRHPPPCPLPPPPPPPPPASRERNASIDADLTNKRAMATESSTHRRRLRLLRLRLLAPHEHTHQPPGSSAGRAGRVSRGVFRLAAQHASKHPLGRLPFRTHPPAVPSAAWLLISGCCGRAETVGVSPRSHIKRTAAWTWTAHCELALTRARGGSRTTQEGSKAEGLAAALSLRVRRAVRQNREHPIQHRTAMHASIATHRLGGAGSLLRRHKGAAVSYRDKPRVWPALAVSSSVPAPPHPLPVQRQGGHCAHRPDMQHVLSAVAPITHVSRASDRDCIGCGVFTTRGRGE